MSGQATLKTDAGAMPEAIRSPEVVRVLHAVALQPAALQPAASQPAASPSAPVAPAAAGSPHDHRRQTVLPWIVRLLDGGTVISATILAAWIGSRLVPPEHAGAVMVAGLVAALVFFLTLPNARAPSLPLLDMIVQQFRFLAPSTIMAGLVQAAVLWSLGWPEWALMQATLAWMLAVTAGLLTTRAISNYVLQWPTIQQRLTRKIAIIGHDANAFRIAGLFAADSQKGIIVAGVFSDVGAAPVDGVPVDGTIAALIRLSQEIDLHGIIIALPPSPGNRRQIARLSWQLRSVLANVFVMPYMVQDHDAMLPMQPFGGVPVLVLQRRPLDEWQTIVKKIVDMTIGLVAFLAFMPLFLAVAIAIKLDSPGPVLFRQPRGGFNSRQFTVYKFRSMHTGKMDLLATKQTSRGDPRVTRVGKWLRRLSIDEIPQLLNVLRGEMSLVGPRPHAPQTRVEGELLNDVIGEYVVRFQVKPGITGWAQVNGARGALVTTEDLRRRVAYDLEYMQRWSAWFDIKIMALTVIREVVSRHAF